MAKVTPLDTRVSITLTREAALHVFPQQARTGPVAEMIAGSIDSVRSQLTALENAAEAIAADDTLTETAKVLQTVKTASKARDVITDTLDRAKGGLNAATEMIQGDFEAELATANPGHGLSPGQALELALRTAGNHGGGLGGLIKMVELAQADFDGVTTLAIYKAPAWALGIDSKSRDVLRQSIELSWSQPHVTARESFGKAADYLAQASRIAIEQATPSEADQTMAADAESGQASRDSAVAQVGGQDGAA